MSSFSQILMSAMLTKEGVIPHFIASIHQDRFIAVRVQQDTNQKWEIIVKVYKDICCDFFLINGNIMNNN